MVTLNIAGRKIGGLSQEALDLDLDSSDINLDPAIQNIGTSAQAPREDTGEDTGAEGLKKFGNILRDSVRFLQGKGLPSRRLRLEQQAQQKHTIFVGEASAKAVNNVTTMLESLPTDKKQAARDHFTALYAETLPLASQVIANIDIEPEEVINLSRNIMGNKFLADMIGQGGKAAEFAIQLALDEDAREALFENQDRLNSQSIAAQMGEVSTIIQSEADRLELPKNEQDKPQMTYQQFAGIMLNMAGGEQDPNDPQIALNDSQMSSVWRHPEFVDQWVDITDRQSQEGLEVGEANLVMKLLAGGTPLEQIEGSLSAKTRGLFEGVTQEQASAALTAGKGITEITTDGVTVRLGVPAGEAARQDVELKGLEDQNIAVLNVNNEIGVLLTNLDEDPTVATSARGLARLAGSAAANVDELIKTFKLDLSDMTIKGPISEEDVRSGKFREALSKVLPDILIQKSAAHQSAAFNLAYLVLASRGVSGKAISDAELKQTIQALGTGLDDPVAQIAALKDVRRQVTSSFNTVLDVKGKRLGDLSRFRVGVKEGGGKFSNLNDADFATQLQNAGTLSPEDRKELLAEGKRRR